MSFEAIFFVFFPFFLMIASILQYSVVLYLLSISLWRSVSSLFLLNVMQMLLSLIAILGMPGYLRSDIRREPSPPKEMTISGCFWSILKPHLIIWLLSLSISFFILPYTAILISTLLVIIY